MRFVNLILFFSIVAFSVDADELDSILGNRFIQSAVYGTFMSATSHTHENFERSLSLVSQSKEREVWRIWRHGPYISIMSMYDSGMFIEMYSWYAELTKWHNDVRWIPTKHGDGAWTFKHSKYDNLYLSALKNGFVTCDESGVEYNKFWIHEVDY